MICVTGFTRSRKVKLAISWYFFSQGAVVGNWAAILPTIKEEQKLTNGSLGLILIASIVGAVLSLPFVSSIIQRFGSGVALFLGGFMLLPLFPIVGLQEHLAIFVVGVCTLGFALGWMGIAMNNQAVLCEKMIRTPSLGLFHAIYAMGGLCGTLFGGALIQHNLSVLEEIFFFLLVIVIPQLFFSCWLFSQQEEKLIKQTTFLSERGRRSTDHATFSDDYKSSGSNQHTTLLITPELATIIDSNASEQSAQTDWQEFEEDRFSFDVYCISALCGLSFIAYLGEGSIGDWSAIYFNDTMNTSPFTSTFGFAGFSLTVAIARLASDYLAERIGRKFLLQLAGIVAALGLSIVASSAWIKKAAGRDVGVAVAVIGFAVAGTGIGVVIPSVISLAGDVKGMDAADAIGLITSIGYAGVVVGPAALGGLAVLCKGLEWSFLLDSGLMLVSTALACFLQRHRYKLLRQSEEEVDPGFRPLLHEDSVIQ
eukprot:gene564-605_t